MVMLPSNAIEFDLDGEQYIGIIKPYVRAEAEQMLTTPAVFPDLHGNWMMMTVKLIDEWIAEAERDAEDQARDLLLKCGDLVQIETREGVYEVVSDETKHGWVWLRREGVQKSVHFNTRYTAVTRISRNGEAV